MWRWPKSFLKMPQQVALRVPLQEEGASSAQVPDPLGAFDAEPDSDALRAFQESAQVEAGATPVMDVDDEQSPGPDPFGAFAPEQAEEDDTALGDVLAGVAASAGTATSSFRTVSYPPMPWAESPSTHAERQAHGLCSSEYASQVFQTGQTSREVSLPDRSAPQTGQPPG